jgi:enamine deaminase RidA (YjgF/YER057c/UK114 family)
MAADYSAGQLYAGGPEDSTPVPTARPVSRSLALGPLVLAGIALAGCAAAPAPPAGPVYGAAPMGLPFSEAVRDGNLLFVSGQIGNVPGKLAHASRWSASRTFRSRA